MGESLWQRWTKLRGLASPFSKKVEESVNWQKQQESLYAGGLESPRSNDEVLFSLPKAILTKQLLKDVWQRIVDSFKNMARSRTGMVFSLIGDLDFYYGEFKWPRHNVPNPCPFCHANQRLSLQLFCCALPGGWMGVIGAKDRHSLE